MSEIKLVALDMDGTLLNSTGDVSDYTKDVIGEALERHVHVVLSTGRPLDYCYPHAEALNLSSFLVTANGGEIWTMDKQLLERHLLDPEVVKNMYALTEHLGLNTWMFTTEKVYFDEKPNDFLAEEWLKFGAHTDEIAKLDQFIKEVSYYDGLELTNSLPTNVEVNPKGVSKASALKRVCREIGITMDQVMAVGDSLNDMKMIQESGIGVAMGNAQEAIKKAADTMTDTNDHDGVAKAIQKYVLDQ
ncbi:Cof-type HAD-IIB family hydrolase [Lentibacillus saliphilus]|uniref:Cof-type HAD-IIB family hydrolase n=1 Tax=Lentibacillus saliphilus TaxID=2737028 RepID=UPI001C2FAD88|nr:Cof-type HAD-IIB family hydrolase [Lentibacillus saliphilus]